jgi:hypothetical protein
MILRKIDDWLYKKQEWSNRSLLWYVIIINIIIYIINK